MKKAKKRVRMIEGRSKPVLEAALKLINTDLKTIKPREVMPLATTIHNQFGGFHSPFTALAHLSEEELRPRRAQVFREILNELRSRQKVLKDFFDNMMARVREHESDEKYHKQVEEEGAPSPQIGHCKVTLGMDLYLEYQPDSTENEWDYIPWPLGPKENYSIRIQTRAATQDETLLYKFVTALNDFPMAALGRCKECKKRFLHTTNRTKLFCSAQCRARRGSRESYKKVKASDPEAYKEVKNKGKERAEKSYQKKIGKLGPGGVIGKKAAKTNKKEV